MHVLSPPQPPRAWTVDDVTVTGRFGLYRRHPRVPQRVRRRRVDAHPVRAGAPREAYFEGLVEMAHRTEKPSQEELDDFYARHDNTCL